MSDAEYNCFARCYRNLKENGYRAEVFTTGTDQDYTDVYFNDAVKAVSFFGIGPDQQITDDGLMIAVVHLVVFCNLVKVKAGNGQRNDQEARIDVQRIIETTGAQLGFKLIRASTGIEAALKEYPGSARNDNLKQVDAHPNHVFRFDMTISYQPADISCK